MPIATAGHIEQQGSVPVEGWEFYSVRQHAALARWRWLYRAADGAIAGESNGGFAGYAECVKNALGFGYPDRYAYPTSQPVLQPVPHQAHSTPWPQLVR
jgi:hypothetical protein